MRILDRFTDPHAAGRTLGTPSTSGAERRGADREGLIAIDHGALRFQPLLRDGWGRQGLSYGPVGEGAGLAFVVGILNGHNSSQAGHIQQPLAARLRTWLTAGGTLRRSERLVRFARFGRYRATARQFVRWLVRDPSLYRGAELDENLSVGLYDSATPDAPQDVDVAFVMHAAGPQNGTLCARVAGRSLPVLSGVQNVPLLLAIVRREGSATYYVASSEPARGVPLAPLMRPVAITPCRGDAGVFPGVQQSTLGQIGFRVDTRVYGISIDGTTALPTLIDDSLTAARSSDGSDTAGSAAPLPFRQLAGTFDRTPRGLCADSAARAWIELTEPAGLVHVLVDDVEGVPPALLFGDDGVESAFAVHVGHGTARLTRSCDGFTQLVAECRYERPKGEEAHSLLVLQEEGGVSICLNGQRLFGGPLPVFALRGAGVLGEEGRRGHLRAFEVHPRAVTIPSELNVPLPSVSLGTELLVDEHFAGSQGDLEGRQVEPEVVWRKELGAASIVLGGARGAVVAGARHLTARARTVYTLPWREPGFADLSVLVMPPGQARGDGEEGRAGVVFWQDEDNYVIVGTWLHNHYAGAAVSSFFCLRGFEDVYDAVWSNVGERVRWGLPYELRVAFDGERFTALLDGEAVLHRALSDVRPDVSRLLVRRVGIVANWEWGNDTGSEFRRFSARARVVAATSLRAGSRALSVL
jgi:hypothetical protein